MTDEKIIDIQTRLAFQDDTIQELNDVIYRQQQQIDKLEKTVHLLLGKVQDLMSSSSEEIIDEKPPHY
ncbi:SlyX family protein [Ketobacter sp. MCCC 1A13808]|uniref:SlyX family protein n=1 Tax=Ketobacter sp. MCCC 1A13808 TaxID=2602738 RepID=UPI000F2587EC|nr:SlyX family protein [Ketobacter sp. MCCC 1A13808]MVF11720.1 SlyX family protein [Ketobacter sp. MCCC 1A13808]RLP55330.1 MAG: SlyX family protein [Ketobacter sp.]